MTDTTKQIEQERAAFEAWAQKNFMELYRSLAADSAYSSSMTRNAWLAWQESAARATPSPVPADTAELPPLPEKQVNVEVWEPEPCRPRQLQNATREAADDYYTADQMRERDAMWAETLRQQERRNTILQTKVDHFKALASRPAPVVPSGEVVVTWDEARTRIVAVTRQDEEGRVLSVIAHAAPAAPSAAQAAGVEPKRRDIFAICDAYESGMGHGLQRDGHKSGAIFGNPECGMAYEIGYEAGEERASGKKPNAPPVAAEQQAAAGNALANNPQAAQGEGLTPEVIGKLLRESNNASSSNFALFPYDFAKRIAAHTRASDGEDAERLDWLVAECAVVHEHGTRYRLCWTEHDEYQSEFYPSPRAAIDAAMQQAASNQQEGA